MEKSGQKKSKVHNYDSSISTTGTPTASPPYSDNIDSLKYANANFIDNSESSTQAKDVLLDFQKIQNLNFEQHSKHVQPPPSKILPSTLPLIDKKSETIARASDSQLREKSLFDMGFKPNEVEGWEQIVQPPKDNLYKLLKNMIDNYIKPNVQIRIDGVTFNCHMMVLQCYSDFFMDCNNEVLIQLPEEKITPTAFMMVYDWMLAEQPLVQREGILELFNAANFLRIKDLINQCWLCLDDDARFREDTAFLLYLEARKYCLEGLEQLMLMRICKFFLTLVASKEFLMLSAREVCALLSSNTIGVNSETEIFMSVVRWLSHNWEERKCHMLDLIRCVRFSLMPPWFLVTLTKNPECPEIEHIVNHAEVRNMINDGITYTTTQFYYGEKREDFLQFLERFQLLTPMQRQWVFDKECNYHHRLECPNVQYVTYKSFLEYLEMILSIGKDYWRTLEMAKGVEKHMQCCVPADCRKPGDPNLTEYLKRASRDQGIQCENASTTYCNKHLKGANKMQSRTGISVSTCRRTPRANPRCTPTVTTYTKSETEYALQDGGSDAYNGNDQDAIKNHMAQQPIMLECFNANDCCNKPQPHRYFRRFSKSRQSKHLTSEDIKTVIFKTNETNDNKSLGGGDCCGDGGNCLNVDAAAKQHVLRDNDEDVKLHMRSILDCNDDGKQNDSDNDGEDGDYRTKIDGRTNAAMPINKSKEFFGKRPHLFKSAPMTASLERYARVDYKVLVIGGIDPYCSHCLHENQPQPQKQQGSRMVSIEHPKNSINNVNVNNKDTWFPNCGDQVLTYDISVLEWRHLSYIPLGSRHHHSAVLCDGLIYVIGGTKTALGCTKKSIFEKSIWCFDPTTLKWVFESSLPESRRDFAVIAINEQTMRSHCQDCKGMGRQDIGFFIIGGESTNGVALNSVWFYSMRRKLWIKKAPLNKGRYGFAAAVVNNEIWVAGGIVKEGSIAMGGGSGSGSGGAGTGAGGDCGDGDGVGDDGKIIKTSTNVITDTIEIYNLKCIHESNSDTRSLAYGSTEYGAGGDGVERFTGQWIPLKLHLRMPRLFGRFCVMGNGELYLVGGLGFDKHGILISLSDIDNFDFERKQWWHCGDLKWPRHGHDVGIINDCCIVAVGGVSTFEKRTLNKVETFCTQTRKCLADLPDLSFPLSGCAVVTIK